MFLVPLVNELYLGWIWRIKGVQIWFAARLLFLPLEQGQDFLMIMVHHQKHSTQPSSCFVSKPPSPPLPFRSPLSFFLFSLFTSSYAFLTCHFYPHWTAIKTILSLLRELILAPIMRPLRFCYSGSASSEDDDYASRAHSVSAIRHDTDSSFFSYYLKLQTRTPLFSSLNHEAVAAPACHQLTSFLSHASSWDYWNRDIDTTKLKL